MTKKQKKLLIKVIIGAVLLVICEYIIPAIIGEYEPLVARLVFLLPFVFMAWDTLKKAAVNIVHGQIFDENFLMSIATVGAYAVGECGEALSVMVFYNAGLLLESIAVGKTRRSIEEITDIRPDTANLIIDGETKTVSPEEVEVGQSILIKPGERIPLDGVITEGQTSINTVALTGESLPRDAKTGERVVSGTVNMTGVVTVLVDKPYSESTATRVIKLIEESSERKAKSEGFITRFAKYYTPVVCLIAVLCAVIPPILGKPFIPSLLSALNFLVISCPCAIVISVPLAFFSGLGACSKNGVLVKGSNYLEYLAATDTMAFDKTGTLTEGSFKVKAIHPEVISEKELLEIAVMAESCSTHPISASLRLAYSDEIDKNRISFINEIAGNGVEACIDGRVVYVGNSELMDKYHAHWHECELSGTTVHVAIMPGEHTSHHDADECECVAHYMGHILVSDSIKSGAKEALEKIKSVGVKRLLMLSGDNESVAKEVADKLGITEYKSSLLPEEKLGYVEEVLKTEKKGKRLAFVGDGINDAPVLSRADVGIAMGGIGSDSAIEASDVVIMDDNLDRISKSVKIAKRTKRIVLENIIFSLAFKAIVAALSIFSECPMWLAEFADVGVMLIAVLNSIRAMKK